MNEKSYAKLSLPWRGTLFNSVLLCFLLTTLYVALGIIAFGMKMRYEFVTEMIFAPEGIALAFTILFGPRVIPGIFLGKLILSHLNGLDGIEVLVPALGNSVESAIGGMLFRRFGLSPDLSSLRDVGLLTLIIFIVLQPFSALIGASTFHLAKVEHYSSLGTSMLYWWLNNSLGQLLFTPLILVWAQPGISFKGAISHAFLGSAAGVVLVIFLLLVPVNDQALVNPIGFFMLAYAILVSIALQLGLRAVTITNVLFSVVAFAATSWGWGPLSDPSMSHRILNVNFFLFGCCLNALLLAAFAAERRQLIEAVMFQLAEAQKRNRDKRALFSIVAHDLRGPVANIKGAFDAIRGKKLQLDASNLATEFGKSIDQLYFSLQNILSWATGQMETIQSRPEALSLCEAVNETFEMLQHTACQKNITLSHSISEAAWVWADSNQLTAIFRNLVSNALKFTPHRGSVAIEAHRSSAKWEIIVSDTGRGMTSERAKNLFKVDNLRSTPGTQGEEGSGLGAWICSQFVHLNGGSIHADSQIDHGTRIYFTLPAWNKSPPQTGSDSDV